MRRARHVILACVGALVAGSGLFLAQQVQQVQEDQFNLKTRVSLVDVPVTVRDQNGILVQNLKKEDFVVLEDGKRQEIAAFSTDPQPLSAVIVVDTGLTGDELRRFSLVSGAMMKEFKATDEFEVYRYDHVVTKLSDFTSNPQNLEKSFDAVTQIADARPADEPLAGVGVGPSLLRGIINRTQIGTNGAPSSPERPSGPISPTSSTSQNTKPPVPSRVIHDALYAAVTDLEKRPSERRRIIILVSNGEVTGENEHAQGEVTSRLYRDGIQVFAVDPEYTIFNHMNLLNLYTSRTGGASFDGRVIDRMARGFAQVIEQARDQYRLGYYSNNEVPGDRPISRNIAVKVINEKHYKVVHRQNYLQYP